MPELIAPPEAHLFYAYGTLLMTRKHRFVHALEDNFEPSVHGHKPWDSSYLLMDYLDLRALHNSDLDQAPLLRRGDRVMELGCGWGAASVHCARRFGAKVTGLDRDADVFPFLAVQAALNDVEVKTCQASFEEVDAALLKSHRLVLGADICFWDTLVDPLVNLVEAAASAGVEHLLMADPGRPPFHMLVRKLLKRFPGEHLNWYALEPKRAEGELLHLRLQD